MNAPPMRPASARRIRRVLEVVDAQPGIAMGALRQQVGGGHQRAELAIHAAAGNGWIVRESDGVGFATKHYLTAAGRTALAVLSAPASAPIARKEVPAVTSSHFWRVRLSIPGGGLLHLASADEPVLLTGADGRPVGIAAQWLTPDDPDCGDTPGFIDWAVVAAITWRRHRRSGSAAA